MLKDIKVKNMVLYFVFFVNGVYENRIMFFKLIRIFVELYNCIFI